MKKGLVLACVSMALCLVTSTVAQARDGFYLAARGGRTWMNLNDKDIITALLTCLKAMEKNYTIVLTASSNEYLYNEYKNIFDQLLNI